MSLSITFASSSAATETSEGRFLLRFEPEQGTVELVGLNDSERSRLKRLDLPTDFWTRLLSIRVERDASQPEALPIVGQYQVAGQSLRFTPRYPFIDGKRYVARFDPTAIETTLPESKLLVLTFLKPKEPLGPPTVVVAIYPSNDVVPENLLKFYVTFSSPMSRGEVYKRVHLIHESGRPVDRPFLELGEELWNPQMTRVTLLLDPGRIKRGLKPREEEGPILEEGKHYTLIVDRAWPDAKGQVLSRESQKPFRAIAPDETQPVVKSWTFETPRPQTRDPLVIRFPEALDQAMLNRAIVVKLGQTIVEGHIKISDQEQSWTFVPKLPWIQGPLTLSIDPELEDLAGNSLDRAFEVDEIHPQTREIIKQPTVITVPNYR